MTPGDDGPTPDQVLGIALISAILGVVLGLTAGGYLHAVHGPSPQSNAAPSASGLTALKDAFAVLQSFATVAGILAAGYLFFWRRRPFPRLAVTQTVEHYALTPATVWLRVQVAVENKGEQIVRLGQASTKVRQVLPLEPRFSAHVFPKSRGLHHKQPHVSWHPYDQCVDGPGSLEVEPGETTTFEVDFFLDADIVLVQVYTFIHNPKKRKSSHGWPVETVHSLVDAVDAPAQALQAPDDGKHGSQRTIVGPRRATIGRGRSPAEACQDQSRQGPVPPRVPAPKERPAAGTPRRVPPKPRNRKTRRG